MLNDYPHNIHVAYTRFGAVVVKTAFRDVIWCSVGQVHSEGGGARWCNAPIASLNALTKNLQNIKDKHADQPVTHPIIFSCCLCWTVVVGDNSVFKMYMQGMQDVLYSVTQSVDSVGLTKARHRLMHTLYIHTHTHKVWKMFCTVLHKVSIL